jgi:hypothetical protein
MFQQAWPHLMDLVTCLYLLDVVLGIRLLVLDDLLDLIITIVVLDHLLDLSLGCRYLPDLIIIYVIDLDDLLDLVAFLLDLVAFLGLGVMGVLDDLGDLHIVICARLSVGVVVRELFVAKNMIMKNQVNEREKKTFMILRLFNKKYLLG